MDELIFLGDSGASALAFLEAEARLRADVLAFEAAVTSLGDRQNAPEVLDDLEVEDDGLEFGAGDAGIGLEDPGFGGGAFDDGIFGDGLFDDSLVTGQAGFADGRNDFGPAGLGFGDNGSGVLFNDVDLGASTNTFVFEDIGQANGSNAFIFDDVDFGTSTNTFVFLESDLDDAGISPGAGAGAEGFVLDGSGLGDGTDLVVRDDDLDTFGAAGGLFGPAGVDISDGFFG